MSNPMAGNPSLALNLAPTRKPLFAASNDLEGSNKAGIVTVRDSVGTPRSVRVVQKEEPEGMNMIRISWFYIFEDKSYTIDLRHGRLSGIRKIYVNKTLVDRDKRFFDALVQPIGLSARSSVHDFDIGSKKGQIRVDPGVGGYNYQLFIDGRIVEAAPQAANEVKSKVLRVHKTKRIGMTLQNNADGPGVIVVQFQPESAARDAGVEIGDILLSINGEPINTHEIAVYKIDQVKEGEAFLMSVAEESALVSARGVRGGEDSLLYT